jgi:hypothetical protein
MMKNHYSHPKGFVGRQLVYKIYDSDGNLCGAIAGGSATKHLPGRNEFFKENFYLNGVINNIFFHLIPNGDKNLGTKVLKLFRKQVIIDWEERYKDKPIGFETLVELPRTGSVYKADNWILVGQTKGFTCKRVGGDGGETWGGKRIWDTKNLRPKLVFCRYI